MKPTIIDLEDAAMQLSKSERGRNAMRDLLAFLDADGLSLDAKNSRACLTLLTGAWGDYAGTVRELMSQED